MKTEHQKGWQLVAIDRLAGQHRRGYFSSKEISDELRKMPRHFSGWLSTKGVDAIIRSVGYRRNDLENEKLLERRNKQGKSSWRLTPEGKKRADEFRNSKPFPFPRPTKDEAIDALIEAGFDEGAIWVLEQKKLTGADLQRLLRRIEGKDVITDPEPAPGDNWDVEQQAIDFIKDHDERKWRRARKANQKGYDLEERDKDGNVITWCEVKAISGPFELSQGVSLSDAQFQMAMDKRNAYWLYIVENVGDAERTRVLAIRNPASLVKRFVFRYSWRFTAIKVIEA